MTQPLGATICTDATRFAVRAPEASALWLCLFESDAETRIAMQREGDTWTAELPGEFAGTRYGYRAEGEWAPERGLWFDPAKLLVDPFAAELDRRFAYDPRPSVLGEDTAALVPKAIVQPRLPICPHQPPRFSHGGLIYEINVRGFTRLHPDIPRSLIRR